MKTEHDIADIDVVYLLKKLWAHKFRILLTTVIFATIAMAASIFLIKPQYESTTKVYVVNTNNGESKLSTQELQAGTYLVKDYTEIILSSDVMNTVLGELQLPLTPDELRDKIKVTIPTDTRIVSIAAQDADPDAASQLANKVREVASQKIKDVTKVEDVSLLEEAKPGLNPVSPNNRRNALLGALLGAFIAITIVLFVEVLDDRIKRTEDIEEVLNMTLLGVVPDVNKM